MKLEGVDRAADHEADVLAVKPRDKYRYGYRLWADPRLRDCCCAST